VVINPPGTGRMAEAIFLADSAEMPPRIMGTSFEGSFFDGISFTRF